jgi:septal ring factor EnvC (AmiA/AmiB activator)
MQSQEDMTMAPDLQVVSEPSHSEISQSELIDSPQIVGEDIAVRQAVEASSNENCASMDLDIQSNALSVSLRSRASLNPETIGLSAQVKLLTEQLAQVAMKLDEANYRIGYLEAQIITQTERAQALRRRLKERECQLEAGNRSIIDWLMDKLSPGQKPAIRRR